MRKKVLAVLAISIAVGTVQPALAVEPYEYFTFDNDAAGTSFDGGSGNGFINSGANANVWNFGASPGFTADGAGNLSVTNVDGQIFRTLPKAGTGTADPTNDIYASPYTNGAYRLEMNFSSWDISGGGVLGLRLQNAGSTVAWIRLTPNTAGDSAWIQLVGREEEALNYNTYGFGSGSTNWANATSAAIEFDLDNNTIEYFINGSSKKTAVFTETGFDQVQFHTDSNWSTNNEVVIDSMGLLGPDLTASLLAVDFDGSSITNVKYTGNIRALNTSTPDLGEADGYDGQPIYAGYYKENGGGNSDLSGPSWVYSDHKNDTWGHGGVKIQINGPDPQTGVYDLNDVITGVAMFKKEDFLNGLSTNTVFMDAENDTLTALTYYNPNDPQRFLSGSFRWVIQDAGQYYISDATVITNAGDHALTAEATEIDWFSYDPESSSTNVAVVGTSAAPALQDIGMIGFQISVTCQTNIAARVYPSFRVSDFSAEATFTPEEPVSQATILWNDWLSGFSMGSNTGALDHADSDSLDNLTEYAWGGDPTDSGDQGNVPIMSNLSLGGTNYLEYYYYERTDGDDRGLSSILQVGTDLVSTNWADGSVYETGRVPSGIPGFDLVLCRIPTDTETKQFIRLQIELIP